MKEYYKDLYGCTASISKTKKGFRLKVFAGVRDILSTKPMIPTVVQRLRWVEQEIVGEKYE